MIIDIDKTYDGRTIFIHCDAQNDLRNGRNDMINLLCFAGLAGNWSMVDDYSIVFDEEDDNV